MADAAIATKPIPLAGADDNRRALRIWLWCVAALVFAMVVVGGSTRLTESGLSITEWKPITGMLPPLSQADWLAEFSKYQAIPQYKELVSGMSLDGFKFIFLWEWSHRLLGRLIGIVFAVPLLVFWLRGMIPQGLKWKLVGVLALGGFQGFVGWWMVTSGLVHRVEVAQQRLAIHLFLASLTLALVVYIARTLAPAKFPPPPHADALRRFASVTLFVVFLQIFLGALVAGLRAGRAYNTWPLMDGHIVPPSDLLLSLEPWWRNFTDNLATVQFQHRMVAYVLLLLTFAQALCARAWAPGAKAMRRAFHLFGAVLVQAALGVMTLLLVVPIWAGLLHQAVAMLVLVSAVIYRESLSRARTETSQTVVSA
ncbi:MAG TPA: COX15/CtaA family protein [Methylovirgula sp.]|jgi:cytochrome c oxidase assembly protein subunit 15